VPTTRRYTIASLLVALLTLLPSACGNSQRTPTRPPVDERALYAQNVRPVLERLSSEWENLRTLLGESTDAIAPGQEMQRMSNDYRSAGSDIGDVQAPPKIASLNRDLSNALIRLAAQMNSTGYSYYMFGSDQTPDPLGTISGCAAAVDVAQDIRLLKQGGWLPKGTPLPFDSPGR
jgi:hypothetical protein